MVSRKLSTEHYNGQHVKQFADSHEESGTGILAKPFTSVLIFLEAQPAAWQTATDQTWNSGVAQGKQHYRFYIVHSYYTPFQTNATAAEIF